MKQAPVSFGETLEQFANFEVIAGHSTDQRDQFLADVFSDGFLIDFNGQVIAALGGIFVK